MVVYVSGKKRKKTFEKQEGRFRRGIRFRNVGNRRDYDQRGRFGSQFLDVYLLTKLTAIKIFKNAYTKQFISITYPAISLWSYHFEIWIKFKMLQNRFIFRFILFSCSLCQYFLILSILYRYNYNIYLWLVPDILGPSALLYYKFRLVRIHKIVSIFLNL